MHNSTPPNPPSGELADGGREQAEDALREKGWEPATPGHWWAGELAMGRSANGEYEASLWGRFGNDRFEVGPPWLCDVGLTPPDAEKESLWLLGIPWPEEVPALLQLHADILSVGHGEHTLDLATGQVLDAEQTRRRLGMPTFAERAAEAETKRERRMAPIRETLRAAWRRLAEGWETYEPVYSFGRVMDGMRRTVEIMAVPYCRQDDGVLLLELSAYYVDSDQQVWLLTDYKSEEVAETGVFTEQYGRARVVLPLPGGAEDIPTPREAMRFLTSA
jgi:hypothetical protein